MCARFLRLKVLTAVLLATTGAVASAADTSRSAVTPLMYGLVGDPVAEQSLLAARWTPPSLSLKLDAAAGLGAHEVRILSAASPSIAWLTSLSPATFDAPIGGNVESLRATYRYTLLARPTWAMKVGLSANVRDSRVGLRAGGLSADAQHFSALPLLHLAGTSQWSPRWRLGFALDGLMTARGRALDLGVQVNYLWSPSMSLYGGYQVTEAAGEAEGYYGPGFSNRANIGLRLRF